MIKKHPIYPRYADEMGNVYMEDENCEFVECSLTQNKAGYLRVSNGMHPRKSVSVHRLVMECFMGKEIPWGMVVDHKNTIRCDNRIENLKLCSQKENMNNHITRTNISDSRKGRKHSQPTREKISRSQIGRVPWNKGKRLSEEHRAKMSIAYKGNKNARNEIGDYIEEHYGVTCSINNRMYHTIIEYHRRNGYWPDDEWLEKYKQNKKG